MATVGDLLQFLKAPQFQLSPIVLTLRNYFQYLYQTEENLTCDFMQSFFDHALSYPHWQQNKQDLTEEVESLLRSFFQKSGEAGFLEDLDWPGQIQVIEVDRLDSALEILQNYWTFRIRKNGEQFRLFDLGEGRFAVVLLKADRSLSVYQCNSQFLIRNGNLEPVQRDLAVHFTANLELDPQQRHKIEIAPYVVARFSLADAESAMEMANTSASLEGLRAPRSLMSSKPSLRGHIVRGYVFQNLQILQGQKLETQPRLFFALKRLEGLFIRRESDPFYKELVETLERVVHWLRLGEPLPSSEVHEIHLRGQTALEEVFRGDKMLTLLLRDLEHLVARTSKWNTPENHRNHRTQQNRPPQVCDSTKSSPTAGWLQGGRPTDLSKRVGSRSTEKKSTNSGSKLIPTKTKFSWVENS